jgi:phage terminase large subunit-like protein
VPRKPTREPLKRSKSDTPDHPTTQYARDVEAGRIVVGHWVKLACRRHLDDLEQGASRGLTFDPKRATAAIDFCETFLRHADGSRFLLAPYQKFLTGLIFGWRSAGVRRFRYVLLEAAKGNGKSPWAAALALTALFLDAELGSELYCAGVTRDVARIQFRDCSTMAQASPELARLLEFTDHNLAMPSTGSFIRPISSEARALDGKRVAVGLIDELMEHPNSDVYDKLRAGTKTRRQPLIISTTNSGYDKTSIAWRLHDYTVRILEGTERNDTWLGLIYALDPCAACRAAGHQQPNGECTQCDQITDERVWPKANPLLDLALPRQYLREQVNEALAMPSKRAIVERLNFGLWTNASVRWLPADLWAACGTVPIDRAALAGKPCVLGVDLGESHDLTALVALFGDDTSGYVVLPHYFISADNLDARARSDRAPYREWLRDGLIEAVPGPIVDFDVVRRRIQEIAGQYDVHEIAIDKWRARQLELRLLEDGLPVVEVPPTAVNIAPAAAALERLLKTGMIRHGNHPVLAWNASNAVADVDPLGNVRPSKVRSGGRIDGIAALLVALVRATQQPQPSSVYDGRGALTIDLTTGVLEE